MKKLITSLIFTYLSMSMAIAADGASNAADAVRVGNALVTWDQVEYGIPFHPRDEELKEVKAVLDEVLDRLEPKLPQTSKFLKSIFNGLDINWSLVEPKLVDIDNDSSSSNLILVNKKKEQLAIYNNGVVQIRHDLWQELDTVSKAFLLFHEGMWFAFERTNRVNFRNEAARVKLGVIRKLTSLIFSSRLNYGSPFQVAKILKRQIPIVHPKDASKFHVMLNRDLKKIYAEEGKLFVFYDVLKYPIPLTDSGWTFNFSFSHFYTLGNEEKILEKNSYQECTFNKRTIKPQDPHGERLVGFLSVTYDKFYSHDSDDDEDKEIKIFWGKISPERFDLFGRFTQFFLDTFEDMKKFEICKSYSRN